MSDIELVERVQNGQTQAYAELVSRYQDRVYNTCWRIVGHVEDARDLTQEAFVKAYENIDTFRRQSGFYTWVFRVAVNLALSHRRQKARRRTVSLDVEANKSGTQAASLARRAEADADRRSDEPSGGSELQSLLVQALNALDEEHRAVVVLRDMEGFDYREIGEILGVAVGTVKSRLHRARMALREALLPALAEKA
jgi:RNA polymerase sigma-70 factor, ECF subfamily